MFCRIFAVGSLSLNFLYSYCGIIIAIASILFTLTRYIMMFVMLYIFPSTSKLSNGSLF
ncbi:hypothetical protein C1645_786180 [Glomus cerebriforme]|uniref:Uncharacterized protein n=1 Tax=Glomus cerebriforme TaxID=658196 RepID=A0A397SC19_9GLOM|nr:hypothetical protein C1645_786180 [Glomus cerebriforme]